MNQCKECIHNEVCRYCGLSDDTPCDFREVASADVAPVQYGQWINEPDGGTLCSACNQRVRDVTGGRSEPVDLSNLPYCPKCGARMNR